MEMDGRDSWELDYVRKDVMGRNNAEDSHEGTEKKGETPLFHLSLSIIPLSRQSFFLLFFSFFFTRNAALRRGDIPPRPGIFCTSEDRDD